MYYYADRETLIYILASQTKFDDPAFLEVPMPPETGFSRWDRSQEKWVALTSEEIEAQTADEEKDEDDVADIVTPVKTEPDTLAVWGDNRGEKLVDSSISIAHGRHLGIPGFLNFVTRALMPISINDQPLSLSNFFGYTPKAGESIVYEGSGKWTTKQIESGQVNSKYCWSWLTSINSSNVTTSSQRRQNGTPTVYNPFTVPCDCNLIKVTVENRPTDTKEFAYIIYVNNKEKVRYIKPQGKTHEVYENLEVEFKKGDRVYVYSASNSNREQISHPGGAMYFREQ